MDIIAQLKRDESTRLTVYDDVDGKPIVPGKLVKGHPTIGVGRALDVDGISADEQDYLLANDVAKVKIEVGQKIPWSNQLDDARLGVLLNMAFNLGINGLLEFHDTLHYIQAGQYDIAATQMLSSAWAREVGARATRLATQMQTGVWQ